MPPDKYHRGTGVRTGSMILRRVGVAGIAEKRELLEVLKAPIAEEKAGKSRDSELRLRCELLMRNALR